MKGFAKFEKKIALKFVWLIVTYLLQKKRKKKYSLQTYNALQEAAKETTCALHNFD